MRCILRFMPCISLLVDRPWRLFEELGSERDKANVMCLEASMTATCRDPDRPCLLPACQADAHFTNGNANKALVIVNKVPTGVQ